MPISTNEAVPIINPISDQACATCGNLDATNNRVRVYNATSVIATTSLCTRCRRANHFQCALEGCLNIEHNVYDYNNGYCREHAAVCSECAERYAFLDNGVCSECGWYCNECESIYPESFDRYWRGENAYCSGCYEEYDSGDDEGEGGPGIRGYGHTHPARWFGGPLPRDEANRRVGYYLGFELEVYARGAQMTAAPINRWERENGMEGFFDCKEDSSVTGFEIATQPFTPAFFETLVADGRLESFFAMLNDNYPVHGDIEPDSHGLHVHIGRVAFEASAVSLAAFSYLLGQDKGKHLERIARRDPTSYCPRVDKPVRTVILSTKAGRQHDRIARASGYLGRNAINLTNSNTVEIRAFRSTRKAEELAAAVRLVYVAADYAKFLRSNNMRGVDPKLLAWTEFCRWTAFAHPVAFPALADLEPLKPASQVITPPAGAAWSVDDFAAEVEVRRPAPVRVSRVEMVWEQIDPLGCGDRNCCRSNFRQVPATRRSIVRGLAAV